MDIKEEIVISPVPARAPQSAYKLKLVCDRKCHDSKVRHTADVSGWKWLFLLNHYSDHVATHGEISPCIIVPLTLPTEGLRLKYILENNNFHLTLNLGIRLYHS